MSEIAERKKEKKECRERKKNELMKLNDQSSIYEVLLLKQRVDRVKNNTKESKRKKRNIYTNRPSEIPSTLQPPPGPFSSIIVVLLKNISAWECLCRCTSFDKIPKLRQKKKSNNGKTEVQLLYGIEKLAKAVGKNKNEAQENASIAALQKLCSQCYTLIIDKESEPPGRIVSRATLSPSVTVVDEDNVGKKIMRMMGWSGGGLGKSGEGCTQPIVPQGNFGRKGLGSFKGKLQLRESVESYIVDWIGQGAYPKLLFTDFDEEERAIIRKIADCYGLWVSKSSSSQPVEVSKRIPLLEIVIRLADGEKNVPEGYKLIQPGASLPPGFEMYEGTDCRENLDSIIEDEQVSDAIDVTTTVFEENVENETSPTSVDTGFISSWAEEVEKFEDAKVTESLGEAYESSPTVYNKPSLFSDVIVTMDKGQCANNVLMNLSSSKMLRVNIKRRQIYRDKNAVKMGVFCRGVLLGEAVGPTKKNASQLASLAAVQNLCAICFTLIKKEDIIRQVTPDMIQENNKGTQKMKSYEGGDRVKFSLASEDVNNGTFKNLVLSYIMDWLQEGYFCYLLFTDFDESAKLIIRKVAVKFQLIIKKKNESLLILKKEHPWEIAKKLLEIGSDSEGYQLIEPGAPLPTGFEMYYLTDSENDDHEERSVIEQVGSLMAESRLEDNVISAQNTETDIACPHNNTTSDCEDPHLEELTENLSLHDPDEDDASSTEIPSPFDDVLVVMAKGATPCSVLQDLSERTPLKIKKKVIIDEDSVKMRVVSRGILLGEGDGESEEMADENATLAAVQTLCALCFTLIKKEDNIRKVTPSDLLLYPHCLNTEKNKGTQIMRSMGWEGGGLGISGKGRIEPLKATRNVGRKGLGSQKCQIISEETNPGTFKRLVSSYINEWLQEGPFCRLLFTDFDEIQIKIIREVAKGLKMKNATDSILISKRENPLEIAEKLVKVGNDSEGYQLVEPGAPLPAGFEMYNVNGKIDPEDEQRNRTEVIGKPLAEIKLEKTEENDGSAGYRSKVKTEEEQDDDDAYERSTVADPEEIDSSISSADEDDPFQQFNAADMIFASCAVPLPSGVFEDFVLFHEKTMTNYKMLNQSLILNKMKRQFEHVKTKFSSGETEWRCIFRGYTIGHALSKDRIAARDAASKMAVDNLRSQCCTIVMKRSEREGVKIFSTVDVTGEVPDDFGKNMGKQEQFRAAIRTFFLNNLNDPHFLIHYQIRYQAKIIRRVGQSMGLTVRNAGGRKLKNVIVFKRKKVQDVLRELAVGKGFSKGYYLLEPNATLPRNT